MEGTISNIFNYFVMVFITITLILGLHFVKSQQVPSLVGGTREDNLHRTHVFQEKARKNPSTKSLSRANNVAIHEVIFAITLSNVR